MKLIAVSPKPTTKPLVVPVVSDLQECYLSATICREARISRDPRFDGKFFVGVLSTGIYCRTVCPAVAPKEENVRYFDSAIKAAQAGLRPCLRCRPDSAPGSNPWKGTGITLDRAIGLIEAGVLSGEHGLTVEALADKLGISSRYLNKLFTSGFGTSPKQFALYRQLMFAKQLLHQTQLPITQVALAAGFNSIRRFNEAFQQTLQLTPTQLRKSSLKSTAKLEEEERTNKASPQEMPAHSLSLYQYYRPPLDWPAQLAFYRLRAVAGMEWFSEGANYDSNDMMPQDTLEYGRTLQLEDICAVVRIAHEAHLHRFKITLTLTPDSPLAGLQKLITQVRRILDLDADMQLIEHKLQRLTDLKLIPKSGLRIPGAGSLFEAGCRAVLGQQVSVVQATKLLNLLVEAYGERFSLNGQEYRLFPTPQVLRHACLDELKMPGARKLALNALAAFICEHPEATADEWIRVKGIGPWTIAYAKLRGLGDPNIFLHTDLIVKKQLLATMGEQTGLDTEAQKQLDYSAIVERVSADIAPWGSYLTFLLWSNA
ncbi:DNA-3-methyladenine glycosylase 2 family protein [Shewanella xiamenensis]|uniref:DNA-3-methyladenine glycosylase 2 family protein n=1 Tax=Shewanella xiamenensis TaxID=332186 RepID=UPI0035BA1635